MNQLPTYHPLASSFFTAAKTNSPIARVVAFFTVGWIKLASSAAPPATDRGGTAQTCPTLHPPSATKRFPWPVAVVALLTWVSIIAFIDPAGSYPSMPEGPGLTVDEIFNAEQGVYLMETAKVLGWLNLVPGTSQEAFRPDNGYYNPDHPPLGRYWLGLNHHLAWWLFPPRDPDGLVVTACARSGSATAFALTILLIGCFATAWSGRFVGLLTAVSLVLMPRVFGHAHLACLETITNLTCTLAVLVVAHWWSGATPPDRRTVMLTGAIFGLAMLTKIQAIFIPIPVIVWAFWRWGIKAALPLVLWGMTALIVFFIGWPYLWFAPVEHVFEYLGRTTHRATINVWYFGQKYSDKLVPWHYSFVMFALTVPVVLHGFGILGLFQSAVKRTNRSPNANTPAPPEKPTTLAPASSADSQRADSEAKTARDRDFLLLLCTLFPLVVFALPDIAVYDCERLFLTSFPLWAIFVGRGGAMFWNWLRQKTNSAAIATVIFSIVMAGTAAPLVNASPCHLQYYNEVTTFLLGGAHRAGLEVDYWGEGITRRLLSRVVQEVPKGEDVAVIPTLHQFQADDYYRQSPILRSHGIKTVEFRENSPSQKYVLVYLRLADLPKGFDKSSDISGWRVIDVQNAALFMQRRENQ